MLWRCEGEESQRKESAGAGGGAEVPSPPLRSPLNLTQHHQPTTSHQDVFRQQE